MPGMIMEMICDTLWRRITVFSSFSGFPSNSI